MKSILLKTILPIAIGSTIIVGCILLDDELTVRDVEPCEDFHYSYMHCLVIMLIIAGIGSFYQLTIGIRLIKKLKQLKIIAHMVDVISFAIFFMLVMLAVSFFKTPSPEFTEADFLIVLGIGTICKASALIFDRLVSLRTVE